VTAIDDDLQALEGQMAWETVFKKDVIAAHRVRKTKSLADL